MHALIIAVIPVWYAVTVTVAPESHAAEMFSAEVPLPEAPAEMSSTQTAAKVTSAAETTAKVAPAAEVTSAAETAATTCKRVSRNGSAPQGYDSDDSENFG